MNATSPTSSTTFGPTNSSTGNSTIGYSPPEQSSSSGGSQPLSVFTFVIAIALFIIVVAFVLLRICMRNRRLRRMGIWPEGPIDRLLGVGPGIAIREVEDTTVPPKLWQAKIAPPLSGPPGSAKGGGAFPGYGQGGCWDNLVPIAASLPTTLFVSTGAAETLEKEKAEEQKKAKSAAPAKGLGKTKDSDEATITGTEKQDAEEERLPGSVNVSVLIAMPSPPKNDGEELPELMIGTAAVPIYTRVNSPSAAADSISGKKKVIDSGEPDAVTTASPLKSPSGYFSNQGNEHSASASTITTAHPTRTQLIGLFRAAQAAKERKKELDKQAAKPSDVGDVALDVEAENEAEAEGPGRERPDTAVDTVRTSSETPTGHVRPFGASMASASAQSPLQQTHTHDDTSEPSARPVEAAGDPLSSTAASLPARPAPVHA